MYYHLKEEAAATAERGRHRNEMGGVECLLLFAPTATTTHSWLMLFISFRLRMLIHPHRLATRRAYNDIALLKFFFCLCVPVAIFPHSFDIPPALPSPSLNHNTLKPTITHQPTRTVVAPAQNQQHSVNAGEFSLTDKKKRDTQHLQESGKEK